MWKRLRSGSFAPGAYRLVVRGDRPEPYSLAWFSSRDDHGAAVQSGPGSGGRQYKSHDSRVGRMTAIAVPEPTMLGLLIPRRRC